MTFQPAFFWLCIRSPGICFHHDSTNHTLIKRRSPRPLARIAIGRCKQTPEAEDWDGTAVALKKNNPAHPDRRAGES
jgi:hypothetical protein